MGDARYEAVSFVDRPKQEVKSVSIRVPSGGDGWNVRLMIACHNHAVEYGYTHWVLPLRTAAPPDGEVIEAWLVFGFVGVRQREYQHRAETREAAEMWVLHRGI